jgi:sporulation protein YabP
MEQNNNSTLNLGENLKLIGRKECFIEGLFEVESSNDNEFIGKLKTDKIIIRGQNLHINKLDLDKNIANITGDVSEIKYSKNIKNKLRKLFK